MGKLTISMAIFNSYVQLPEGTNSIEQEGIANLSVHLAIAKQSHKRCVFMVYFTASID